MKAAALDGTPARSRLPFAQPVITVHRDADGEIVDVSHSLGGCGLPLLVYACPGCKRLVPWCFGAADDMPDHCDDCWSVAHVKETP